MPSRSGRGRRRDTANRKLRGERIDQGIDLSGGFGREVELQAMAPRILGAERGEIVVGLDYSLEGSDPGARHLERDGAHRDGRFVQALSGHGIDRDGL